MTSTTEIAIDRTRIAGVATTIGPYVRRTPVVELDGRDLDLSSFRLTLKLELLQHAGSFKTRGAFTNLLLRQVPPAGVVAASGGNHGAAVAFAARQLGLPARIFVPTCSSQAKVDLIRSYGATLVISGDRYADALTASDLWATESGAMPVHAFDQEETLLGQGTLGRELEEQAPDLSTVLVPVGGGGLIGGIAAWYGRRIKVIGVEPELSPTLTAALRAGMPVDAEANGIAADSLAPRRVGERVFPIAREYVSEVLLVSDDDIRRAQRMLWSVARIVAEPGGSAAFAGLLGGHYQPEAGEHVGVVISGGNTHAVPV